MKCKRKWKRPSYTHTSDASFFHRHGWKCVHTHTYSPSLLLRLYTTQTFQFHFLHAAQTYPNIHAHSHTLHTVPIELYEAHSTFSPYSSHSWFPWGYCFGLKTVYQACSGLLISVLTSEEVCDQKKYIYISLSLTQLAQVNNQMNYW